VCLVGIVLLVVVPVFSFGLSSLMMVEAPSTINKKKKESRRFLSLSLLSVSLCEIGVRGRRERDTKWISDFNIEDEEEDDE